MESMEDMEELEKLREKKLAERDERIQNIISLIRKLCCVLLAIAVSLMFFYVRNDYNNYAGSQLVMAEVIGVEDASDENISVTYRYNIAGKEYESNKVQHLKKIKNGDKEEIRSPLRFAFLHMSLHQLTLLNKLAEYDAASLRSLAPVHG